MDITYCTIEAWNIKYSSRVISLEPSVSKASKHARASAGVSAHRSAAT